MSDQTLKGATFGFFLLGANNSRNVHTIHTATLFYIRNFKPFCQESNIADNYI